MLEMPVEHQILEIPVEVMPVVAVVVPVGQDKMVLEVMVVILVDTVVLVFNFLQHLEIRHHQ
jgi:hypothetical protein